MEDPQRDFDTIILGAGVSGLAAAFFLIRAGQRVCIIEEYPDAGGNHISRDFGGFTFDVGSIFFGADSPQFAMFPGSEDGFVSVPLTFSRVTPRGDVQRHPLSIRHEIFANPIVCFRFLGSLAFARLFRTSGANAETYAIYHIGHYLYVRSGLRNYLQRFYGISPTRVNLQFVERRMNLAVLANWRRALLDRIRRTGRPRASFGQVAPCSLARPAVGFPSHYTKVVGSLRDAGAVIHLATPVKSFCRSAKGMQITTPDNVYFCSRLVNTLPLVKIFDILGMPDRADVSSTSLCTLCCSFQGHRGFTSVVLYNFHDEGPWKRVTVHSDYYGKRHGREFFNVEITLNRKNASANELFEAFADHVRKLGLFVGDLRLEGHFDLSFAYPICDENAEARRLKLIKELADMGIDTMGRQGLFDYIPHSSIAIEAARKRFGAEHPAPP